MTSKLTKEEFNFRLTKLTKIGEPTLLGTPLAILTVNNSSRPFFGKINSDKFQLTKNSSFLPIPFTIVGTYRENENKTFVDYQVKPIWFGYLWIRIFPIVGLILFNTIIINTTRTIIYGLMIPVNIVLLLTFLPIPITNYLKTKFEKEFTTELEIEKN